MPQDISAQQTQTRATSEVFELLRAQNPNHPDKAVGVLECHWTTSGHSGRDICVSRGGGTTKADRDAFVEIKLAREQEKHLSRWMTLLKVGTTECRARFCSDLQVSLYELRTPQE